MSERRARTTSRTEDSFRRAVQDACLRAARADEEFLSDPINAKPRDVAIFQKIQALALQDPTLCIVRYFSAGHVKNKPKDLYAWVFHGTWTRRVSFGTWACLKDNSNLELPIKEEGNKKYSVPDPDYCAKIWKFLIEPWISEWRQHVSQRPSNGGIAENSNNDQEQMQQGTDVPRRILLIPTDELFAVPLHVALEKLVNKEEAVITSGETQPLAMRAEVFYSASAAVYLDRGNFLRKQVVKSSDDLWAHTGPDILIHGQDCEASPNFLENVVKWDKTKLYTTGENGNFEQIVAKAKELNPEFVVLACHGETGLLNFLAPNISTLADLSPLDVALRLRLDRNKLTMVNACLSGFGANAGAEIDGFLRAFVAAGVGVLTLTLWHVRSDSCTAATKYLLEEAIAAAGTGVAFDCVEIMKRYYCTISSNSNQLEQIEHCLFAIYY